MKWVKAWGPWKIVLWFFQFDGITMPWRTVYLHPEFWDDENLRRHEMIHIKQIDRDGPVMFSIKYLWWAVRYGYQRNPYEIEAFADDPR